MTEGKILPIVGYGSPILKELCLEIDSTIDNVDALSNDLIATMKSIGTAVGLAAPQINSNLSMFVMRPSGVDIIVINPIIRKRRSSVKSEEGCLSIPGLNAIVPDRDEIIDVEFYDVKFNKQKMRLRGFDAIVFQHEYDHLNGVLYTDRLTKEGREQVADRLAEIEKGHTKNYYDMIFPGTNIVQIKQEKV